MNLEDFKISLWTLASEPDFKKNEIEKAIRQYCRGIPVTFSKSYPARLFVRSSINGGAAQPHFDNISWCSYPPDRCIPSIGLQRANYPGQQIFYCSYPYTGESPLGEFTCILETALEHITDLTDVNTFITLSRWDINRDPRLIICPFADWGMKNNPVYRKISFDWEQYLKIHSLDYAIPILKFFSDLFCEKVEDKTIRERIYRITSAYTNYLFAECQKQSFKFDGILYPSANSRGTGINLALKKELLDSGEVKPVFAIIYHMKRDENNLKQLSLYDITYPVTPGDKGELEFELLQEHAGFQTLLKLSVRGGTI